MYVSTGREPTKFKLATKLFLSRVFMMVAILALISLLPWSLEAGCAGFGCGELKLSVGVVKGNVWDHGEEYLMIPYATSKR